MTLDFDDWAPTYRAILAEFGYDEAADRAAARLLRPHARHDWTPLHRILLDTIPTIVGCAPGLEDAGPFPHPLVAADGATTRLRELGQVPDIVVTDLDGAPDDLAWAAAAGSHMVVHAHGDNQFPLRTLAPVLAARAAPRAVDSPAPAGSSRPVAFLAPADSPYPVPSPGSADPVDPVPRPPLSAVSAGSLYATCQCDPAGLWPVRNLGGFTDGDRAVHLCKTLGARGVRLAAFDLDAAPSRYSHRFDPATKPAKLAWARRIIEAAQQPTGDGRAFTVAW